MTDANRYVRLSDGVVDLVRQTITRRGVERTMSSREAELLGYLATRPGQTVTRDELLDVVWAYRASRPTRAVDLAIRRLRSKIEPDPGNPTHVVSVHGMGYRFVPPDEPAEIGLQPRPRVKDRHNLPAEVTSLIGRQDELAHLERLFTQEARLVTILGPGGIGKTRLAIGHAWAAVEQLKGGAIWCDLSPARALATVVDLVAHALEVPVIAGERTEQAIEQLGRALAARGPTMLLLDNFEQVAVHAAATVGRWQVLAPDARILLTSRERLRLPGEWLVEVGPLTQDEAIRLFRERASALRPDPQDPAEVETIGRIVERLDRIPLAIELAASRVRSLTPDQILDRLDQRFRLLADPGGSRPERHATMLGALKWSWDLLTPVEQRTLTRLAVFAGGFDMEAAEAVCETVSGPDVPWTPDLVQALRDRCWVSLVPNQGKSSDQRYRLLETVRLFVQDQAFGSDDYQRAVEHHAAYYIAEAERQNQGVRGHAGVDRLNWLARERANLLAAHRRAATPRDRTRSALALVPLLRARGPHSTLVSLLESAVETASGADAGMRVRVLLELSRSYTVFGSLHLADELTGRVLALTPEGDDALRADALWVRSTVHLSYLRLDEAEADARAVLELCRKAPDLSRQADAERTLSLVFRYRDRLDEAERWGQRALARYVAIGDRVGEGRTHADLARVAEMLGRRAEAEYRLAQAILCFRDMGDLLNLAITLTDFRSVSLEEQDRMTEAIAALEEGLGLYLRVGELQRAVPARLRLAQLYANIGDLGSALAHAERAHRDANETGIPVLRGIAEVIVGATSHESGEPGVAEATLRSGLQACREARSESATAIAATALAMLLFELGRDAEAIDLLDEALASPVHDAILRPLATALRAFLIARSRHDRTELDELITKSKPDELGVYGPLLSLWQASLGGARGRRATEAGLGATPEALADLPLAAAPPWSGRAIRMTRSDWLRAHRLARRLLTP